MTPVDSTSNFVPDADSEGQNRQLQNPAKFLHETGLLYLINKAILHQYGVAIYYGENEEGHPEGGLGISVSTDGQPFDFDPVRESRAFDRLTSFRMNPKKMIEEAR